MHLSNLALLDPVFTTGLVTRNHGFMVYDQLIAVDSKFVPRPQMLSGWTESDFRTEVDMFGNMSSKGSLLVTLVLAAHAAYRMQLFCYLKSCGREELNTMNLWAGVDGPM